ncbi:hypothetical protein PHYBLDRAFT_174372 [Phycomyces blakesleeanus NRRL 1555(-)]|uniref:Uncharacterized protein n=1 Tax=Phycomyces blakesleeanus (strain ATCC 8743b / DSM 1359 / FGSC 10004 / NBRC 33097 / NRRL 1555) TaxID=763407 RepID=A0A162TBC9_PHYB8|nr:hypothetical protein PHYBLDRAFT_174372 [Phycomyces blakesleeanus NRRL 1555(-)]OAD67332.1 hypothetical protein PHYBLDRAFT_174372 [Phycomyces blakesleeanus NRRL 1555(-)]|eukprot:XP_018285372.1 hypothetical protein PHYBLDRAFT_174372 [Phycomyces blakesleeanus NRRL 1555(-)]
MNTLTNIAIKFSMQIGSRRFKDCVYAYVCIASVVSPETIILDIINQIAFKYFSNVKLINIQLPIYNLPMIKATLYRESGSVFDHVGYLEDFLKDQKEYKVKRTNECESRILFLP